MCKESRQEIERELPPLLPRLWRLAMTLTRQPDHAEDLVQNACIRILENTHAYTPNTRFDSWAFTVLINVWRSDNRRNGRYETEPIDTAQALEDTRATSGERQVFLNQVLMAIDALPAEQSAVVTLVYGEGYTYAEVADILDVPVGTIMSRLHNARRKLAWLNSEGVAR